MSLGIRRAPFSVARATGDWPPCVPSSTLFRQAGLSPLPRAPAAGFPPAAGARPVSQHVIVLSPLLSGYVENDGLEPSTPCLQGRRSSQLS